MSMKQLVQKKLWRGIDPYLDVVGDHQAFDKQGWGNQHSYLRDAFDFHDCKFAVEVGVWKGGGTIAMAKQLKQQNADGLIVAVDTWLGSSEHWVTKWFPHLKIDRGYPTLYRTFINNVVIEDVIDIVVPLPLDSVNASNVFKFHNLRPDLIHIDGGHDYVSVSSDLNAWWPILADGGWLIGDDYYTDDKSWPEVRRAFQDFFKIKDLEHTKGKCRIQK